MAGKKLYRNQVQPMMQLDDILDTDKYLNQYVNTAVKPANGYQAPSYDNAFAKAFPSQLPGGYEAFMNQDFSGGGGNGFTPFNFDFGSQENTIPAFRNNDFGAATNNADLFAGTGIDTSALFPDVDSITGYDGQALNFGGGGATPVGDSAFTMKNMFGGKDQMGWLTGGAQTLSGLAGAYTGIKGLDLAEESFDLQKGLAKANLANQSKLTNYELQNKFRARNQGASDADVARHMAQYGTTGQV